MQPPSTTQPPVGDASLLSAMLASAGNNQIDIAALLGMAPTINTPGTPVGQTRYGRTVRAPPATPGTAAMAMAAELGSPRPVVAPPSAPQSVRAAAVAMTRTPSSTSEATGMSRETSLSTSPAPPVTASQTSAKSKRTVRIASPAVTAEPLPAAPRKRGRPKKVVSEANAEAPDATVQRRSRGRPRTNNPEDRKDLNKESARRSRVKKKEEFEALRNLVEAQEKQINSMRQHCDHLEDHIELLQKTIKVNNMPVPPRTVNRWVDELDEGEEYPENPTRYPQSSTGVAQPRQPLEPVSVPQPAPTPVPQDSSNPGNPWHPSPGVRGSAQSTPSHVAPPFTSRHTPHAVSSPVSHVRGSVHETASTPTSSARDEPGAYSPAARPHARDGRANAFHPKATFSTTPAMPNSLPSVPNPLDAPTVVGDFVGGDDYDTMSISALFDLDAAMEEDDPNDTNFVPPTSPKHDGSDYESDFEEEQPSRKRARTESDSEDDEEDALEIEVHYDDDEEEEDLFMPIEDVPHPDPADPETDNRIAGVMAALKVHTYKELRDKLAGMVNQQSSLAPEQVEMVRRLLLVARSNAEHEGQQGSAGDDGGEMFEAEGEEVDEEVDDDEEDGEE